MAVDNPVKVPKRNISSVDESGWPGGWDTGEPQNVAPNSFTDHKDIQLDAKALIEPRDTLVPFLPDTVETTYQKFPVDWNDTTYYFVLDDSKAKFCEEGATGWTDCDGVDNSFTTDNGGKPKFLRVLDTLLILNGKNGNKIAQVDLTTAGFPVTKYTAVADPTVAPTATLTNLTAGSFKIYYAYSYVGAIGETKLSPILTQTINIVRDQWAVQTSPGSIKLTFPAAPTGAKYRNVYVAVSSTGGTIQDTDMVQLFLRQDVSVLDFTDDGTLDINLGGPAPTVNSTDGFRANNGIVEDGRPILFDDDDEAEAIHIGGDGPYGLDFSTANGGYKAKPESGTNYKPKVLIGFRNGQGQPSITVLFQNSEGISKQSVLEQQTVNYGDSSFTVWGVTEQHYGAAGVAATESAINYNGKLLFWSDDGVMGMDTEAAKQNVLSTNSLSAKRFNKFVRGVKNSATSEIIGAGWNNRFIWTVPNDGFDTAQQLLVLDDNNAGAAYTHNIPADWIGVISPRNGSAFVYISRGTKSYKFVKNTSTYDMINGVPTPFSTRVSGSLRSLGGDGYNSFQGNVQTVIYLLGIVGSVTVGVRYRNQNGKMKEKSKTFVGPSFTPGGAGGWGDPGWVYHGFPMPSWSGTPVINTESSTATSVDKRIKIFVGDIMSEAQWFVSTGVGFNHYKLKVVSYEGINLGVTPDL